MKQAVRIALLLLGALAVPMLAACSEIEFASHVAKRVRDDKSQGLFKVGNPYKVDGKWYTPKEDYTLEETGIASWYGDGFKGKKTANGEVFDPNELTAAHRTLQLPSLVRVTNLENGKSLIVRVNDRGPFKRSRVMDVSRKAADLLGFRGRGTAKVKLQVLAEESKAIAMAAKRGEDTSGTEIALNQHGRLSQAAFQPAAISPPAQSAGGMIYASTPVPSSPIERQQMLPPRVQGHTRRGAFYPDPIVQTVPVKPTSIYVQAGAFTVQENAARLANRLSDLGQAHVYPATISGRQFYRVRIPVDSVELADSILAKLAKSGNAQAIIVVE